ncbi:MAG TPA: NAD(P)-dependent oxidoreductase [Acidimicrobiales bacterium]|nr:NAD(P)-dependent oxidoreductase [Acidimicrobiales bacterium]
MKIAITGARGRMGTSLCAHAVRAGHEVVAIDARPPGEADATPGGLRHVTVDVTDFDELRRSVEGCDRLVHLAAFPSPGGQPAWRVHNDNVVGSYNALLAGAELGISHIAMASSINATGAAFSRRPRYDYFPLDERHPTYNEDPYSLSKWVEEAQSDSIARRYENLAISSMRLHRLVESRAGLVERIDPDNAHVRNDLWGYTTFDAASRAFLAALEVTWKGHQAFYIVAPDTCVDRPTADLLAKYYPEVPLSTAFEGNQALYRSTKAEELLGWSHDG